MSGTLNKVMLIGHLGDDVKMHYFEGGNSIGRFPLATNETYTNKQTNEKVTNTDWHNIVVRNKAAEVCEKYLKKGDKVYVEGRLKNRSGQGEEGQTRYSTEVHVTDFTFLTSREGQSTTVAASSATSASSQPSSYSPPAQNAPDDDDLPF